MRFVLPDGREITGRSYTDVVAAMADEKFEEPRSLESYRMAAAARASSMYNVIVDATDDRSFVKSLEAADLLRKVEA